MLYTDDWTALYVDGKCEWQDHTIPETLLLDLLRKCGAEVSEEYWEPSELEEYGYRFPDEI